MRIYDQDSPFPGLPPPDATWAQERGSLALN
jgi:hypothetical protein